MVVAVLFKAGDQVPVILLFDVVGNVANVAPEQIEATWVKPGLIIGLTVKVASLEIVGFEESLASVTTQL